MSRSLAMAVLILGVALALLLARCAPAPRPDLSGPEPGAPGEAPLPPIAPPETSAPTPFPETSAIREGCAEPVRFVAAAAENRANLERISWAPFGRAERGWATYAPFVGQTVGTACPPDSPRFAEALASWAGRNGLSPDGVLDDGDFARMKNAAHALRPFVAVRGRGVCPNAPDESRLVTAGPGEGYRGKAVQMRPAVLAAYRRMVVDARRELPELSRDPDMLDIFSAYRSPSYDAARCARDGNCQGITRAQCSPHRTGLALDIVVGGNPVDSTNDANRRAMSETAAYRWLVKNARRYGFVNYVFEPWHWEYVEEPV
jgi:zinc D-Ala-D-Ala carboxypeptidase